MPRTHGARALNLTLNGQPIQAHDLAACCGTSLQAVYGKLSRGNSPRDILAGQTGRARGAARRYLRDLEARETDADAERSRRRALLTAARNGDAAAMEELATVYGLRRWEAWDQNELELVTVLQS